MGGFHTPHARLLVLALALLLTGTPALAGVPHVGSTPLSVEGTASDGFVIRVEYGPTADVSARSMPDVEPFAVARRVLDYALAIYEEYLAMGLKPRWSDPVGRIFIERDSSLWCMACASGGDGRMRIYLSYAAPEFMALFGESVPRETSYQNTLGHEMFHALHGATGLDRPNSHHHAAISEGLARMSETLHRYSSALHHNGSILYSQDKEGCNGYDAYAAGQPIMAGDAGLVTDMDLGMAVGPFDDGRSIPVGGFLVTPPPPHTYDACYFWLAWYGAHGAPGLAALLAASGVVDDPNGFIEAAANIEAATGEPIVNDLARFAQASLTGRGYTWAPPASDGPALDWGLHLDRWAPAALRAGESAAMTLSNGGMMARAVEAPITLSVDPAGTALYLVRENGASATTHRLASGSLVSPGPHERVWVVAIHPMAGSVDVTLAAMDGP